MAELKLISAPAAEPITLAELKAHCRIEPTDTNEDGVLNICIAAARAKAEGLTGRALITQRWEQGLDAFPGGGTIWGTSIDSGGEIELLKPPVQSIVSVKYYDVNGALQTLSPTLYTLLPDDYPGWLLPLVDTDWPDTDPNHANAVLIQYDTGYGATLGPAQADLKIWLLMAGAFLWANREALVVDGEVREIPGQWVDGLLDPFRVWKA